MKRKYRICIYSLVVIGAFLMLTTRCKKSDDTKNPTPDATVTDIEGNVYHTVIIGTQTWMVENLKTTKYRDGKSIPNVTDDTAWSNLTTSGYCWYNNEIANKNVYGALYNWYAVNTQNICPDGWHIPSVAEFTTLINYLGGYSVAGGKMREKGYTHWAIIDGPNPNTDIPNPIATNESGFTSLPAGYRYAGGNNGEFLGLGFYTSYWTSTPDDNLPPIFDLGYYGEIDLYHGMKPEGYSVRCIKD